MHTARLTKSSFRESPRIREKSSINPYVAAFIGGLVLFIAAVVLNSGVMAAIAFVPFVSGFLYLNAMFWAELYEEKKIDPARDFRGGYY